jgi:transposase
MIQITPHMRILVAVEPIDFRASIDGLARICQQRLQADPFCGWLFVFRNRRGSAIKVLGYDGQGFWLCQKRLSCGRFRHWPQPGEQRAQSVLQAHELQVLLMGGDPATVKGAPAWRALPINQEVSLSCSR